MLQVPWDSPLVQHLPTSSTCLWGIGGTRNRELSCRSSQCEIRQTLIEFNKRQYRGDHDPYPTRPYNVQVGYEENGYRRVLQISNLWSPCLSSEFMNPPLTILLVDFEYTIQIVVLTSAGPHGTFYHRRTFRLFVLRFLKAGRDCNSKLKTIWYLFMNHSQILSESKPHSATKLINMHAIHKATATIWPPSGNLPSRHLP